jgi:DNA-binding NarL/FixJ family response regulator
MIEFNESNPITIVMADDHEVVRAGIRRLLSIDRSLKILDEAINGQNLIDLVRYHKPDIALTDIMMPIKSGIEAAKEIKETIPETNVLMLTAYEDSYHLEQALSAGADGYLSKDVGAKELIESIHNIMNGERVFSKSIIKLMQKKFVPSSQLESTPISISKREQEILNLVSAGKTSQDIAEKLNLSVRTVESHRYNIMQKLGIKNAAGLVRYAVMNYDV